MGGCKIIIAFRAAKAWLLLAGQILAPLENFLSWETGCAINTDRLRYDENSLWTIYTRFVVCLVISGLSGTPKNLRRRLGGENGRSMPCRTE